MNLLKIQNELRSVPDSALIGYVQNPQPHVPTYLALSELERRQNMRKKAVQGEAPSSSVAEDVVAKEKTKAPVSGLAGMMGGAQPAPVQAPQPTMMAEGGLASLPVKDDLYPEEFAVGGMVAFADGGDVPGFAEGKRVFSRELTQAEYDALSTEDKTAYDKQFFGKRMGRNMLKPFAAAADIVTSPYNMGVNLLEKGLNAVDFARLGRTAGIYDPDVTSVKIPGSGSMTPYYDRIRRSEMVDTGTDPNTGAKKPAILPNKPAIMIAEENAAKIRKDIAAGKYDKKPKTDAGPAIAPTVDVPEKRVPFQPQPERSIGEYAKELSDYLGPDTARAEGLARIAKMEEQAQKQKDMAPWMALAEAGLGIAAGSSPFALQNIGTGALLGVKSYGAAQKEYQSQLEKANALRTEVAKAERAEKVAIGKFGADSKEAQRERDFKERLQSEKIATEYDLERMQQEGAMARVKEQVRSAEKIAGMNIEAGRWDRAGGGVKGALTEKQIYDIREGLRDQARKEVLASPEIARLGEKQRTLPQNAAIINRAIEQRLNELVNREIQGISASRNPTDANTINPLGNMSYSALLGLTGGTK